MFEELWFVGSTSLDLSYEPQLSKHLFKRSTNELADDTSILHILLVILSGLHMWR
jgi:hypothetical protein